ncbi:MAG: hypothetical protein GTO53_00245 [Planctomycetales bacterium]|nr:hypothetical protein [Planctomycetales bacterium]NIM07610.1 hypothetical protein [Planctomycetales bacterium]NIN07116.1 hypothetical protein [Planctomycetales bacterium]NIN76210.1 hypothetical protein [Planctomycetales bacterium]NIO33432.1 hypothetical protein [Planctomycetales bacterium]
MPRRDWKLLAYLELLRLPNVFTAVADVLMGGWLAAAVAGTALPQGVMALAVAASGCLYLAGMVWNDYFDRNHDLQLRPARPIPSRRVPESAAQWLGSELIILGVALAMVATYFVGWRPAWISLALAAAVLAYDGLLKSTWFGPVNMGLCRTLNVLLGMSVITAPWQAVHYTVAGGIGLYIVGVTWFARTEASTSNRALLLASTLVMWAGMAMLAWFPNLLADSAISQKFEIWYFFWLLLGAQIGWRCLRAVGNPQPAHVQLAVKNALFSLIIFDAAVTMVVQGWQPAILILLLLVPSVVLSRWMYVT